MGDKSICVTCKWAEWQRTPTGRIKSSVAGRCKYPIEDHMPTLPASMELRTPRAKAIWSHRCYTECPVYEPHPPGEGGRWKSGRLVMDTYGHLEQSDVQTESKELGQIWGDEIKRKAK